MRPRQSPSTDLSSDARRAIATSSGLKVRRAARRITQYLASRAAYADLSVAQFDLMVHVAVAPVHNLGELAARMGLDQTTLSRNLQVLKSQGLIRTTCGNADRRRRSVSLTESGLRCLQIALPVWCSAQESLARLIEPGLVDALEAATELLVADGEIGLDGEVTAESVRTNPRNSAAPLTSRKFTRAPA